MGSPAQPFLDWRDKLQKAANWLNNQDAKPQQMNWKPEPNEEQKKQIAAQYAPKKVAKKRSTSPQVRTAPLANKRVPRKKMQ